MPGTAIRGSTPRTSSVDSVSVALLAIAASGQEARPRDLKAATKEYSFAVRVGKAALTIRVEIGPNG